MTKDIFDRLSAPAPRQLEDQQFDEPELIRRGPQPIIPPAHPRSLPSEKLLSWMINCWDKPIITARDIGVYGPYCARDPINKTRLTKTLVEYGWLVPVKAWRRDVKKWRIIREPGKETPTQV